jgi:hypothetical protein
MSSVPLESGLETKLVVTLGVVQVVSNSVYARTANVRGRRRISLDIERWNGVLSDDVNILILIYEISLEHRGEKEGEESFFIEDGAELQKLVPIQSP